MTEKRCSCFLKRSLDHNAPEHRYPVLLATDMMWMKLPAHQRARRVSVPLFGRKPAMCAILGRCQEILRARPVQSITMGMSSGTPKVYGESTPFCGLKQLEAGSRGVAWRKHQRSAWDQRGRGLPRKFHVLRIAGYQTPAVIRAQAALRRHHVRVTSSAPRTLAGTDSASKLRLDAAKRFDVFCWDAERNRLIIQIQPGDAEKYCALLIQPQASATSSRFRQVQL